MLGIMLALLPGCQAAPPQISLDESSSGGPPESTSSATMNAVDDTVGPGSSGSGADGTSTVAPGESSSGGTAEDGDSTGEVMDEPLGPFGEPVAVVELDSMANDDDPTLTEDMLEIYFASTRDGGDEDIYVSTRDSVNDPWDSPERVDALNSDAQDTFPEVSPDGLTILLTSRREGGDFDVFFSRRPNRDAEWSTPVALSEMNTAGDDYGATPTYDMSTLFLSREDALGAGSQADILVAEVDFDRETVTQPMVVPELSSAQVDISVTLSPSQLEIFFETTRTSGTLANFDLWVATRESVDDPWGEPVPVEELNTGESENDPWLSPDRTTLYFASDRGPQMDSDIYMAVRSPL